MLGTAPPGRTIVKFCGCTSAHDACAALEAGADAVGMIFAPSPRRIGLEEARAIVEAVGPDAPLVGVFVDPEPAELERALAAIPGMVVQFSGHEPPALCARVGAPFIKVFHLDAAASEPPAPEEIERYGAPLVMFDTASRIGGGSGTAFRWEAVAALVATRPALVSGGLTARNVGQVVRTLHPYGVDVRSGIETGGAKDPSKMRAFVRAVREAENHAEA